MQSSFIEYIYLILIILGLVMLANKLRLAYPIVLVLGGLAISFVPAFRSVTIDPDLVFFIFLPPLLYEAAWQVSWKEFWKWRRAIVSFAFPIVIITSCVVAFLSTALIPGFTLALGFLLGGIISPPDAVSTTSIMRRVKAPKTLVSIAEGESLLNDASSLIVFRFALVAVVTGQFYFQEAAMSFFIVVMMGILIGIIVALIFYAIHRWLPVTPRIEIILTLVTPYCMYYTAEHFHYSGVLAVVSGGLYLSFRRLRMLDYKSRLQGVNVWNSLVFVLNGLIFLLIGLQLPLIISQLGEISLGKAIWYGLAITSILILTRLICTFCASVFSTFMSKFITVAEPNPGWKLPLIHGWAGIRGVVSLAAALSIPLYVSAGKAFPFRDLILFITFIVILVTLVLQGLTLPWLIRKLDVKEKENAIPADEQEKRIQRKLAKHSLERIEEKFNKGGLSQRDPFGTNEYIKNLHAKLKTEIDFFNRELADSENLTIHSRIEFKQFYLELLEEQRKLLEDINLRAEFDEDIIRKYQALIDLEEFKIREKYIQDSGDQ